MEILSVNSGQKEELIDITNEIRKIIKQNGFKDGLIIIFVPHTTAGVFINEGADPDVVEDILQMLKKNVPDSFPYKHAEGNSTAHIKSLICGSSINIILEDESLKLGTWQSVFFGEFDGPRHRQVWIKFLPA